MLVIPAIDLKDGRCVRLKQGIMSQETVFSEMPEQVALKWEELGAERIHVVDLNGAIKGRAINGAVISKIIGSVSVPIQLGGGIRDLDTIRAYLELGVSQVILGTVAVERPELVEKACGEFPGRIMLAIDARDGKVASRGWTELKSLTPVELANRFDGIGLEAVIYTDITRDGMKSGPNLDSTRALASGLTTPVIASGGVSCLEDIEAMLDLESVGVIGVITGRAVYDGSLDLREAIRVSKEFQKKAS